MPRPPRRPATTAAAGPHPKYKIRMGCRKVSGTFPGDPSAGCDETLMLRYEALPYKLLSGGGRVPVPKVLVADDSPLALRMIEKMLASAGYAVLTARDGLEAIEIGIAEGVDL